ncbi:nitrate- and nitrite sensing domain-containing protein [Streptosporangium sp. NPDC049376]|uniref:sensor histidine kinase n=1 Tax=Streptosporangium sp. NPDC049376 TaxID=3366192 RepID=UPI0037A23161
MTQDRRNHRESAVGSRFLPSNWRVRPRLVALILLPTAAAVVLSGLQLTNSLTGATEYRKNAEVASLIEQLTDLSYEMADERDLTAWYIADRRRQARLARVKDMQGRVDLTRTKVLTAIDALGDDQEPRIVAEVAQVRNWLNGLFSLRKALTSGDVLPRAALGMYTRMIADFMTLHDDLGRSARDQRLVGDVLALGALTQAREQVARQRGILLVARIEGRFDFDDPADFLGAYKGQLNAMATFRSTASTTDIKRLNDVLTDPKISKADAMRALVISRMRENLGLPREMGMNAWYEASSALVDGLNAVERSLAASVTSRSQELQAAEEQNAIVTGATILVLLIMILLVTAWVAGTLVRPLRQLRSEALEVAGNRLPETVRVLRETGEADPSVEVSPIDVDSRDEIGEVARAFDEIHREAIRLAGDEARLRNNVNAMFINLSRRTQSLVERQIDLIDDLEQGEQDDAQLASLFKLDHLATRMRRNSENLLVLAGQEQSRRWSEPVPLSDVVRASLSEVENYERVGLRVEAGTMIVGSAVNDIVHLIAELVENAIFFSPQDTKIMVSGNANETGAIILAVTDSGIGMSDEELAEANRRLAEPPAVDLSVSRRMGLFVVGRLAMRHGIRVQLRRPETGGLSAVVLLPPQVVAQSPLMPQLAMAGQNGPSALSGNDPFSGAPSSDPFGSVPSMGAVRQAPPAQPSLPVPPAPEPSIPQNPAPSVADLWSAPVVSAAAVEDLWASPLTPSPPSFPPAHPSFPAGDPSFPTAQPPRQSESSFLAEPSFPAAPPSFPAEPSFPAAHPSFPADSSFSTTQSPFPGGEPPRGGQPPAWPEMPPVDPWTPPRREVPDHTQALPAVEVSPTEPEPEEFLPIFAAVGSDWFRNTSAELVADPEAEAEPAEEERQETPSPERSLQEESPVLPIRRPGRQGPPPSEEQPERQPWSSPSDQGWAAAEVAKKPVEGGVTGSGLPKRVPKANLVPGTAAPAPSTPVAPLPPISAERVRSRLSSFQQGIRQGRAEMIERLNAAEGENQ